MTGPVVPPGSGWRARVADWPVARLATVRPSGAPRVVPCCFALDGDDLYFAVDHKPKSSDRLGRLDDIAGQPAVSLVVDHFDPHDWSALWWARLDGDAAVLRGPGERERALDLLAAKYPQYRDRRPHGPVVRVRIHTWRTWSADPGSGFAPQRQ